MQTTPCGRSARLQSVPQLRARQCNGQNNHDCEMELEGGTGEDPHPNQTVGRERTNGTQISIRIDQLEGGSHTLLTETTASTSCFVDLRKS